MGEDACVGNKRAWARQCVVSYDAVKLNYMQSPRSHEDTWHEHRVAPMHNAYGILLQ